MKAGIYKIKFPNGKFYIGSSQNTKERLRAHRKLLQNGKHVNRMVQNCYNKYKIYETFVILICRKEDLIFYEQLIMNKYKPELNACKTAGALQWTNFLKKRVSEKMKIIKNSQEEKIAQSQRTKKLWQNEEYRKNQSEKMKERMKNENQKEKLSKLASSRWNDPAKRAEIVSKMREAAKRKKSQ